MQNIDAKAVGLLTHVSMMIAALGFITASLVAERRLEEGIIIFEIPSHLLLAIGCLRCLNLFSLRRSARTTDELIAVLRHEILLRRELYMLCARGATFITS